MSELHEIRVWNPVKETETVEKMTMDEIIESPTNKHLIDVGIVLLNEKRQQRGLSLVDPSSVSGSIQDLRSHYR